MRAKVRVKICGMTNVGDAMAAAELGVDALGFVCAPSPRQIPLATVKAICRRLPPFVSKVGVFVDAHYDDILRTADHGGLDTVQLHGQEPPELVQACVDRGLAVIKAFRVRGASVLDEIERYSHCGLAAFLLDAYVPRRMGGTGQVCDWQIARRVGQQHRTVLAGGLHPGNVRAAIAAASPWAIDVSSGVENHPGCKCITRMAQFVQQATTHVKERETTDA
jgi:phosphoribosylanthranilate isomerase